MNKKYFIENGYLEFKNLLDKSLCKKLNNKILKTRKIDEKIFFENKREYLKNKNRKIQTSNILSKFNLDFIYKNKKFQSQVENILGKDYFLYASRVV